MRKIPAALLSLALTASLTAPLPPPPEVAEDEILRRGHLRVLRGQKDDA